MHAKSSETSDFEIIRRVMDGDVNAYEHLLKRYEAHVLRIVKRHIPYNQIEEIAQDVFVRAYQSLSTFKKKSGFKQWLSTITVRTCYDFWRKAYRSRELPMSALTEKHMDWVEQIISHQSNRSFYESGSQKETRELRNLDRYLCEFQPPPTKLIIGRFIPIPLFRNVFSPILNQQKNHKSQNRNSSNIKPI